MNPTKEIEKLKATIAKHEQEFDNRALEIKELEKAQEMQLALIKGYQGQIALYEAMQSK